MIGVKTMKKCERCNVQVYDSESHCPLCRTYLGETTQTSVQYLAYENIIKEKTAMRNLPLFITLFVNIICLFINIFTHNTGDIFWSVIVVASMTYSLLMYYIIRNQMRYGKKVLYSYIYLSSLLVIIDIASGCLLWSTNYVFPFLTMFTALYITVLTIRNKRMFSEYFGFLLAVTAISFLSVILYLFRFNTSGWGAFIPTLTSVILSLGLYFFAEKNLKEEIKKHFHR